MKTRKTYAAGVLIGTEEIIGDLATEKIEKIAALNTLAADKIALGWIYGANTYQCYGKHRDNMKEFATAYGYFLDKIPLWLTATVYALGDVVKVGRVFYKCTTAHTSVTWATEGANWAVWFFHPSKDGDGKWRSLANVMVSLTLAQCIVMVEGALNYGATINANVVKHKDAINALTTALDVTNYNMSANPAWPANT